MAKLFGFKLTETSALLLFIFALGLLFVGIFYGFSVVQTYNQTSEILPMYLILTIALLGGGFYILMKTVSHRNK